MKEREREGEGEGEKYRKRETGDKYSNVSMYNTVNRMYSGTFGNANVSNPGKLIG